MIGIVPCSVCTLDVEGEFNDDPTEGKLYADPTDKRLYYCSRSLTRSCPQTGFFPVWDGHVKYVTRYSNCKYLPDDVILVGLADISSKLTEEVASSIRYRHRKAIANDEILEPMIRENDNMFTQVVKGTITVKKLTIVDLVDMSALPESTVHSYYSALIRIAFMRIDRWLSWVDQILRIRYVITVYRGKRRVMSYDYPSDTYEPTITQTELLSEPDQMKRLVKLIMQLESISKTDLCSDEVDDYTVNNMITTLGTNKPLSAQLFSRFTRMAGLTYTVEVRDDGKLLFTYRE